MNIDVSLVPEEHSGNDAADVISSADMTSSTTVYLREELILPRYYYHYHHSAGGYPSKGGPRETGRPWGGLVGLLTYLSPVILVVCTLGNVLGAVVVRRFCPHVLSTTLYVFAVLVLDLVVVWSRCGLEWLSLVADVDVRDLMTSDSIIACKIYPFLSNLVLHLDSWLLVAMAAETVFVHQRPQRLMRVCCLRRARVVLALIVVSLCLIDAQYFWSYSRISPHPDPGPEMGPDDVTDDDDDDDDDDDVIGGLVVTSSSVCANWVVQSRRRVTSSSSSSETTGSGFDFRRISVMVVDLVVTDLGPFFVIFSCCVMLLTKRLKRHDQVRQIDNTWKVCNVDSSAAHQLHTCFIVLCVLHTVFLFPNVTYKSFLFVTDFQVTGLLQHPLGHGSSALVARAVCYCLRYVYLSCKLGVFLAACPAFRRQCRLSPSNDPKSRTAPEDAVHVTSAADDHVTTGVPLLQTAADRKCETSASAILENGGQTSIKIFSMTSV